MALFVIQSLLEERLDAYLCPSCFELGFQLFGFFLGQRLLHNLGQAFHHVSGFFQAQSESIAQRPNYSDLLRRLVCVKAQCKPFFSATLAAESGRILEDFDRLELLAEHMLAVHT